MADNTLLKQLKGSVIVSCQSEGEDPFNTPSSVALFAKAACMGGAKAIRSEGVEKIKEIKRNVNLPVIGLIKGVFPDGSVRITGSMSEVEELIAIKCDILAVDGTFREREGLSGPQFIKKIKQAYPDVIIMADIATLSEAEACRNAGADMLSTTLSGYTPETYSAANGPDFDLVEQLVQKMNIPVVAEGRMNSPEDAKETIRLGAYAVVVGTAITRPRVITQWYVDAISNVNVY